MKRRIFAIFLILLVLVGCFVLYFVNPSEHTLVPCIFHELTGLNCPGCGITRASYSLLHLDLAAAVKFNAFFVLTLILVPIYVIIKVVKRDFELKTSHAYAYLFCMIVFTVFRNIF